MRSGFLILALLLRRGSHRRRGKKNDHSKRSEDLRTKTFRHKRLPNHSAVLHINNKFNHDCRANFKRWNRAGGYFAAGPFDMVAACFTNFAAGTAAFACTSLSSVVDCPSVHVICHLKGTLTPETTR